MNIPIKILLESHWCPSIPIKTLSFAVISSPTTTPQVGHVRVVHRTTGRVLEQPTGLCSRAVGRLLEAVAWPSVRFLGVPTTVSSWPWPAERPAKL